MKNFTSNKTAIAKKIIAVVVLSLCNLATPSKTKIAMMTK
jgi:hypothetical protein